MAEDKRKYKGKKFLNASYFGDAPETIDECDTWKEARENRREYLLAYGAGWRMWISQRPIAGWN